MTMTLVDSYWMGMTDALKMMDRGIKAGLTAVETLEVLRKSIEANLPGGEG